MQGSKIQAPKFACCFLRKLSTDNTKQSISGSFVCVLDTAMVHKSTFVAAETGLDSSVAPCKTCDRDIGDTIPGPSGCQCSTRQELTKRLFHMATVQNGPWASERFLCPYQAPTKCLSRVALSSTWHLVETCPDFQVRTARAKEEAR